MKRFLKKMVSNNEYKNSSYVMRDALIRLMDEKDSTGGVEVYAPVDTFEAMLPHLTASIMVTIKKFNQKLERKLNKLEIQYHKSILNKAIFCHQDLKIITYVLEDTMVDIQSFITEINGFEDIQSFRYSINEPEE